MQRRIYQAPAAPGENVTLLSTRSCCLCQIVIIGPGDRWYRKWDRCVKTVFASALLLFGVVVTYTPLTAAANLDIAFYSAKNEYVIREPVKFVVKLENHSDEVLRIVNVSSFDMNMEFMELEVTYPNGERRYRKGHISFVSRLFYPMWLGEQIFPGETIITFLYPNVTYAVDHRGDWLEETFPVAGEYRLRVVYTVPEVYYELWKGPGGKAYSNEITVVFREPDPVQREILDAYWLKGGYNVSMGDDSQMFEFDRLALANVAAKYPDQPFVKYALFALARDLTHIWPGNVRPAEVEQGIAILLALKRDHPDFRADEIGIHVSKAYLDLQKYPEARASYAEVLAERPWLKDHDTFMMGKIRADTNEQPGAVTKWRKQRITRASDVK